MRTDSEAVLLTGATGFLGRYLCREIERRGLRAVTAGRRDADLAMDLADAASIRAAVAAARPRWILNCGAMSSMGACAADSAAAAVVNARAPAVLAEIGPRTLQVSTDLVFDGRSAPYAATAEPSPTSAYGETKAAGEAPVVDAGGLVARVPLLFGRSFDGRRGATDMLRAAGPDGLSLFTNEFRTPLHAADAARGLIEMLIDDGRTGVVHLAGRERISRWDFGQRFAAATGVSAEAWRAVECDDPSRPRDVSLVTDWDCGRDLDEALRESGLST